MEQIIPFSIILSLLATHFVADFVSQSDWMAINKSKNNWALSAHVMVYSLVILLVTSSWTYALLNGILHFGVDYVTSRINSKLWEKKAIHYFFVSIGFDQLLHYVCLFSTYLLILA